jgi:hypothetical protein
MVISENGLCDKVIRVQTRDGEWYLVRTYADVLKLIESEINRGSDRSAEWSAINGEIVAALGERSKPRLARAMRQFRELLGRLNMLR